MQNGLCLRVNREGVISAPFWGVRGGPNFRPQMSTAELPFLESPGSGL